MAHVTYSVLLHRGEWQIEHNGIYYGPHSSKENALRLAIGAARIAERDGDSAEVLVLERARPDMENNNQWQPRGRSAQAAWCN